MNRVFRILVTLSALLGAVPFIRPRTLSGETILWVPKLLAGALSPVSGLIGVLGALVGLARRNWALAGLGLVSAGLAARLSADQPEVDQALSLIPEPADRGLGKDSELSLQPGGGASVERDLVFGRSARSGHSLLADLWLPAGRKPSGLGMVYAHGSGWRVGGKDMGTRWFFRELASRGHVVLDIGYSLWPSATFEEMVAEVNRAILWLKEQGGAYGVDPDRVVAMGASAGAHLALMAAYTPGHPAFRPTEAGDTSVRGVVAFYPPVDLSGWQDDYGDIPPSSRSFVDRLGLAMLNFVFRVRMEDGRTVGFDRFYDEMLGGSVADILDAYRLLSPIYHVGSHCPPTLLLQGVDDLFGLAPGVRRLHQSLLQHGVPSALLEFPHAEHGFDLVLPQISPMARTSTRGVIEFLDRLQ